MPMAMRVFNDSLTVFFIPVYYIRYLLGSKDNETIYMKGEDHG